MKDIFNAAVLLAIVCYGTAHGAILPNTSLIGINGTAHNGTATNRTSSSSIGTANLKRDVDENFSVVQDWNSVCAELCGADLGGTPCASHCEDLKDAATPSKSILYPNKIAVCQDLCNLQLGGSICGCLVATNFAELNLHNDVCNSFCQHNNVTLNGCSRCVQSDPYRIEHEARSAQLRPVAPLNSDVTTPSTTSTTPDWNKVCISFCKTGDGGALCNCDLPPLL